MAWTDERVELLKKLWAEGLERKPNRGSLRRRDPQRGDRQGASARTFGTRDQFALQSSPRPAAQRTRRGRTGRRR